MSGLRSQAFILGSPPKPPTIYATGSRTLTEMTLMLLVSFATQWPTGVSVADACEEIKCSPEDLQPVFNELQRAGYIRQGAHGYIADEMLRTLVAGMLIDVRGVN